MNKPQIIGLAGTNGSGKDTVGHILASTYGYFFMSVTELLRNEATRRGLPVEREVLREISAEWRRELGLGVLVDKAVAEHQAIRGNDSGVVMASLRNPGEADRVHAFGGVVIWVDADPRTRYERIQANKAARGRVGEDDKTFEQFLAEEEVEMHTPKGGDDADLNSAGVKDRCDLFIDNNGSSVAELRAAIETALND